MAVAIRQCPCISNSASKSTSLLLAILPLEVSTLSDVNECEENMEEENTECLNSAAAESALRIPDFDDNTVIPTPEDVQEDHKFELILHGFADNLTRQRLVAELLFPKVTESLWERLATATSPRIAIVVRKYTKALAAVSHSRLGEERGNSTLTNWETQEEDSVWQQRDYPAFQPEEFFAFRQQRRAASHQEADSVLEEELVSEWQSQQTAQDNLGGRPRRSFMLDQLEPGVAIGKYFVGSRGSEPALRIITLPLEGNVIPENCEKNRLKSLILVDMKVDGNVKQRFMKLRNYVMEACEWAIFEVCRRRLAMLQAFQQREPPEILIATEVHRSRLQWSPRFELKRSVSWEVAK